MIHLRGILGLEKGEPLFLKGRDSFALKEYSRAFSFFKRAELAFAKSENFNMQITA